MYVFPRTFTLNSLARVFSQDKAEVLFDLHEEGLRDCLYCTLNRVPSPDQVSTK